MITVPEAARRLGRNPETVRRWIRAGKLRSTKAGTQHLIDEQDLEELDDEQLPLPEEWEITRRGEPQPNWAKLIELARRGDLLTVREAARRLGKNPETIRRWIRSGRLRSRKVGMQHLIDERDLEELEEGQVEQAPVPDELATTFWGEPQPNVVKFIRLAREGR